MHNKFIYTSLFLRTTKIVSSIAIVFSLGGCNAITQHYSVSNLKESRWILQSSSLAQNHLNRANENKYSKVYLIFKELNKKSEKIRMTLQPSCNRYTADIRVVNKIILFSDYEIKQQNCQLSTTDQFVIDGLKNALITQSTKDKLVLVSNNRQKMIFKSLPLINQAGIKEHTWYVSPKMVACNNKTSQKCLKIREQKNDEWQIINEEIFGFDFKEGVSYRIKVLESLHPYHPKYSLHGILKQVLVGTRQVRTN